MRASRCSKSVIARAQEVLCPTVLRDLHWTEIIMAEPQTNLTKPIISAQHEVLFSAYGFGWGYCSLKLPPEAAGEVLGAADGSTKQLMLAFQLGKYRIMHVGTTRPSARTGTA
jgi:hypothetical protein